MVGAGVRGCGGSTEGLRAVELEAMTFRDALLTSHQGVNLCSYLSED